MKHLVGLILLIGTPATYAQPDQAARFVEFSNQLDRMCNNEFVTLEQARACKTGGTLAFGAPRTRAMSDYLVLLDQCTATYQDAGAQFAPAIPAAELRAACQTGLVWTRSFLGS